MKHYTISYGIKDKDDRPTAYRKEYDVQVSSLKTSLVIAYNDMEQYIKDGDGNKIFIEIETHGDVE